jgi:hypothetical protein
LCKIRFFEKSVAVVKNLLQDVDKVRFEACLFENNAELWDILVACGSVSQLELVKPIVCEDDDEYELQKIKTPKLTQEIGTLVLDFFNEEVRYILELFMMRIIDSPLESILGNICGGLIDSSVTDDIH